GHVPVGRCAGLDDDRERGKRQGQAPLFDLDPGLNDRVRGPHHRHQAAPRMKRLLSRLRNDDGHELILLTAVMVAIVGGAAFVVDVGGWFRQQRATQSIVDAAALAGAQALPNNPANAILIAKDYGAKNGQPGELADANISITSIYQPNDTITVTDSKPASF